MVKTFGKPQRGSEEPFDSLERKTGHGLSCILQEQWSLLSPPLWCIKFKFKQLNMKSISFLQTSGGSEPILLVSVTELVWILIISKAWGVQVLARNCSKPWMLGILSWLTCIWFLTCISWSVLELAGTRGCILNQITLCSLFGTAVSSVLTTLDSLNLGGGFFFLPYHVKD